MLFMTTLYIENTTVNPRTKNMVFKIMFVLFTTMVFELFCLLASYSEEPEIYAKNAGTIGSIHGAKNDASPIDAAPSSVASLMLWVLRVLF